MAEANGPRRALNVHGIDALGLRTLKNNGGPWDFNLRRDREEALQLIDDQKPTWVIGSPPCTYFSAWQHMNFKKMSAEDNARRFALGRVRLKFVAKVYWKQIQAGRYLLHEHPKGASSRKVASIQSIRHFPEVATTKCDHCVFGCIADTTKHDGKVTAMKPTRSMSN